MYSITLIITFKHWLALHWVYINTDHAPCSETKFSYHFTLYSTMWGKEMSGHLSGNGIEIYNLSRPFIYP